MPKPKSNTIITEPLKFWRNHRGYSQVKLARLSQISNLTISQLEAGKRAAQSKTLSKLLSGLNLSREEFFAMETNTNDLNEIGTQNKGNQYGSNENTELKLNNKVELSNLDLELLNRILNLNFESKLNTLKYLQLLE